MKLNEDFICDELKDYRSGFPHWGLIDGGSIDVQVCAESKCDNCGHIGLKCEPFIKEDTHSYRAFATCPECNESFEF